MDSNLRDQLAAHLENYDKQRAERTGSIECSDGGQSTASSHQLRTVTRFSYGTAGFRGNSSEIEHLFYNVGLISALRCLQLDANVGVMITASHNPVQDNGVKLIDSNGEMLDSKWEPIVEEFCNTHERDKLLEQLDFLIREFKIGTSMKRTSCGRVMIGIDTRPSSGALAALVKKGIEAWSSLVNFLDYGLLTTPALHYLVAESNKRQAKEMLSLQSYYEQLIFGLERNFQKPFITANSSYKYSPYDLIVDCANGVGCETMQYFCKNDTFNKYLPVKLINVGDGILNKFCGADYVKTVQLPPSGADDTQKRYASLDGDADRVVYFFLDRDYSSGSLELKLLDGDKIMALYAIYLKDLMKRANLDQKLTLGIVQTAYANGASTDFMTLELGLKVDFVDTGVKNLHKQALKYDLAIYFEANGHGTIWTSLKARSIVMKTGEDSREHNNKDQLEDLKNLFEILNNYTGDAISDILIVETILRYYNWDVTQWYSLYQDRPSSLIKVEVLDRNLIKTTNAARTCTEPKPLQPAIDFLVSEFGSGARCFVRPSGTENVVRIYAEAGDQISAEKLAANVGDKVRKLCSSATTSQ